MKFQCLFLAHNLDLNSQLSIKSDHLEMQWGCFFFRFLSLLENGEATGPNLTIPLRAGAGGTEVPRWERLVPLEVAAWRQPQARNDRLEGICAIII